MLYTSKASDKHAAQYGWTLNILNFTENICTYIFPSHFCVCFKLLELNFLEYCIFNTLHYLVYDNSNQVYAFWEISCIHEDVSIIFWRNSGQKKKIWTLSPRTFGIFGFYSDMAMAKTKAASAKRKLLGNFVSCPLSWHWFWKASYCDTLKQIICLQSHLFVNPTVYCKPTA